MVDQAADGGHGGGFVGEHLVSLAERLVGGEIGNERPSQRAETSSTGPRPLVDAGADRRSAFVGSKR